MTHPRSRHLLEGLFALAILLPLGAAQASPAPSSTAITRRLLDKREVAGAPGLETQLWLIEYPPGAAAPVHHHPVVGIGYVVEGEFESAFGHEPPVRVKAGQSFVDPARVEHRLFRNVSAERPLKFIVTYTIPAGQAPVEMGPPPHVELRSSGAPVTIAQPALYPETIEVDPRRSSKGTRREAGVGIYDLTSGRPPALRRPDAAPSCGRARTGSQGRPRAPRSATPLSSIPCRCERTALLPTRASFRC